MLMLAWIESLLKDKATFVGASERRRKPRSRSTDVPPAAQRGPYAVFLSAFLAIGDLSSSSSLTCGDDTCGHPHRSSETILSWWIHAGQRGGIRSLSSMHHLSREGLFLQQLRATQLIARNRGKACLHQALWQDLQAASLWKLLLGRELLSLLCPCKDAGCLLLRFPGYH